MKIYMADKQAYVDVTFEEVMRILMKNGASKLTCLHNTK